MRGLPRRVKVNDLTASASERRDIHRNERWRICADLKLSRRSKGVLLGLAVAGKAAFWFVLMRAETMDQILYCLHGTGAPTSKSLLQNAVADIQVSNTLRQGFCSFHLDASFVNGVMLKSPDRPTIRAVLRGLPWWIMPCRLLERNQSKLLIATSVTGRVLCERVCLTCHCFSPA